VADSFDAMTSDRPYRAGMPHSTAGMILVEGANTQWDGELVVEFLEVIRDAAERAAVVVSVEP
jgi:HD-GYP domain-containing protein (c-di-GMP phosphodiesterase class II)